MKKLFIQDLLNHSIKSEMNFQINELNSDDDFKNHSEIIIYDHNFKLIIEIEIENQFKSMIEIKEISSMKIEIFNERENIILYKDYLELFLLIELKSSFHIIESNLK